MGLQCLRIHLSYPLVLQYESCPVWLDWKALSDVSMSPQECQARWAALTESIPKQRTMFEILRAAMCQFQLAKMQVCLIWGCVRGWINE